MIALVAITGQIIVGKFYECNYTIIITAKILFVYQGMNCRSVLHFHMHLLRMKR